MLYDAFRCVLFLHCFQKGLGWVRGGLGVGEFVLEYV